MTLVAIILLAHAAAIIFLGWCVATCPLGYEDSTGFHAGEEPEPKEPGNVVPVVFTAAQITDALARAEAGFSK